MVDPAAVRPRRHRPPWAGHRSHPMVHHLPEVQPHDTRPEPDPSEKASRIRRICTDRPLEPVRRRMTCHDPGPGPGNGTGRTNVLQEMTLISFNRISSATRRRRQPPPIFSSLVDTQDRSTGNVDDVGRRPRRKTCPRKDGQGLTPSGSPGCFGARMYGSARRVEQEQRIEREQRDGEERKEEGKETQRTRSVKQDLVEGTGRASQGSDLGIWGRTTTRRDRRMSKWEKDERSGRRDPRSLMDLRTVLPCGSVVSSSLLPTETPPPRPFGASASRIVSKQTLHSVDRAQALGWPSRSRVYAQA